MIWGERWEGGSGLGTHVHPWLIHANVWQNQYSIVKQNKVKIKIKKKKKSLYHFLLGLPSDDELFKFLLISKILLTLQF